MSELKAGKRVHHIYTLKNPTKMKKYKRMGITEQLTRKGWACTQAEQSSMNKGMNMRTNRTIS